MELFNGNFLEQWTKKENQIKLRHWKTEMFGSKKKNRMLGDITNSHLDKKKGLLFYRSFKKEILVSCVYFLSFAFYPFFYPNICYWKGFRAMLGGLKNNDWRITMGTYCSRKKKKIFIFISFIIKKRNRERENIYIVFFFLPQCFR